MLGQPPKVHLIDGTWACGGSIRRWFTGEKQNSDIDIFRRNEETERAFIVANSLENKTRNEAPNTLTWKDPPIQIIRFDRSSIEEVLENFDFTICQFGWDGNKIWTTPEAIISTTRKHLAVAKIQEGYELDSLRRAFKYAESGYCPCLGTLKEIGLAFARATAEKVEQQSELSPGGGMRQKMRWD